MAFFGKDGNKAVSYTGTTNIANGTEINGDLNIECNLHVDGVFNGNINSKAVVIIGKSGIINGDLVSNKLIISGLLKGSCSCEVVEILPDGVVSGNITTKEFVIERGGFFEGDCKFKDKSRFDKKEEE